MRQVRLIPALALILGAALFISACGGDDSPETPITVPTTATTSDLSKDEFIEEADAICEEANASIGQFVAAGEGFTEAGEIADIRQGVLDDLQDLGPPEDDRRTLDDFLSALEAQVEAGEKIALANERGTDTAEFETELDNARAEAESAGADYGFEECGAPITATDTSGTAGATDPGTSDPGAVVPAEPAPVTPAPAPAPDTGGTGGTGDSGGTGDTGGDTGGGGVTPGGGGVGPG